MHQRIYIYVFIVFTIFALWFQNNYMQVYSDDFELQKKIDRSQSELVNIKDFKIIQYVNNSITSIIDGVNGSYTNNGKLTATGGVHVQEFNADGSQKVSIVSTKVLGNLKIVAEGNSFLDSTKKLETLYFPDKVTVKTGGNIIHSKAVNYQPTDGILTTKEHLILLGKDRRLEGTGLTYEITPGKFNLGGPITGYIIPPKKHKKL